MPLIVKCGLIIFIGLMHVGGKLCRGKIFYFIILNVDGNFSRLIGLSALFYVTLSGESFYEFV